MLNWKQKIEAAYFVTSVAAAKKTKFLEPPKVIQQYVRGLGGLPSAADASVKKYKAWLQTQLGHENYKVYRAFVYGDEVDEGDDIFSDDPLSFTELKSTALAIAEDRHDDQPDDYAYVVEITAPADRVYFHHKHGGELGREHSKEKEVMVSARRMDFKIIKEYKPENPKNTISERYHIVATAIIAPRVETLTREYFAKFFSDMHLPLPHFKTKHSANPKALGFTHWSSANPGNTTITLERVIMGDETTLRRILLHELIHHADFVKNAAGNKFEHKLTGGHGKFFREHMQRINSVLGKDFITERGDATLILNPKEVDYWLIIRELAPKQYGYQYAIRLSSKQKEAVKTFMEQPNYRVIRTKDRRYLNGSPIKLYGTCSAPREPEQQDYLEKLYSESRNSQIQVA